MKGLILGLIAAFAVWLGLVVFVPSARQGWICYLIPGTLGDFFYPRVSAELREPYRGMPDSAAFAAYKSARGWCDRRLLPVSRHIGKQEDWPDGFPAFVNPADCCYPALALVLVKPFAVSQGGALAAVALGTLLLMLGVGLCARRIGLGLGWSCAAGLMAFAAAPTLRAIERGQLILFAAAGVAVFLAWHDSERPVRRLAAALALAAAGALKLTPAVFGVLYLKRGVGLRGIFSRDLLVFAAATLVLLFVPFVWFGGWDGFLQWVANAAANGKAYAPYANWGIIRLHRIWLSSQGLYPTSHVFWLWFRCIEVAVGSVALALGWWRRNVVLVTVFLLLVPGNMMAYTGVYLLPALLLSRPTRIECLLWFAVLCPLQLVIGSFSLNTPASLFAFWILAAVEGVGRCCVADDCQCEYDTIAPKVMTKNDASNML